MPYQMTESGLTGALDAWCQALGEEAVLASRSDLAAYERNVGGFKREVGAVLRPASTEQVIRLVEVANRYRIPLYPFSTGLNWGMGSKLPVQTGNVLVDLRRMNTIRELNADAHYAVVEPGVTQQQLYDRIQAEQAPLMLNVIGSSRHTSLLGNALDRGVGYFALRADTLSGMEIVLGSGKRLQTGFAHFASSKNEHLYKFGLGPSLDGLFAQSNYGIVTAAGIDLMPKPEAKLTAIIGIAEERLLPRLVDALAAMRRQGVIRTITHIANQARGEISIAPVVADYVRRADGLSAQEARARSTEVLAAGGFGPWSAVAGLMGTKAELKAARKTIKRRLGGFTNITFLTAEKVARMKALAQRLSFLPWMRTQLALANGVEPFFGLTQGIPTDAALASVYWPLEDEPPASGNPDDSRSGVLYCLPFIPLSGQAAQRAVDLCKEYFGKFGFVPYITLNVANSKAMETVINLAFDRLDATDSEKAHTCIHELQEAYKREGWLPYRLSIGTMGQFIDEDDIFWQTTRDLKQVLDPNHIISPGRYSLV